MAELSFRLFDIIMLTIAAITAVGIIHVRSLFAATMLTGFYSLLMALVWQNMDAVDVSFTEAAVGAGISTILLLGAVLVVGRDEKPSPALNIPALLVVTITGIALIYGTLDMPRFGDPDAKIHNLRVPNFVNQRVGKAYPLPGEAPKWEGEADRWPDDHVVDEPHPDDGHDHDEHAHATVTDGHGHDDHGHHAHPSDDWDGHVPNTVTSVLASYRGYDTMMETAVIFSAGMGLVLLLRRRRDPKPKNDEEAA